MFNYLCKKASQFIMIGRIVTFFAGISAMFSCATPNMPEIRTLCLRDDIGNYIVKWETFPQMDGALKVYVSDVPNYFDESTPVALSGIKDGITTYITIDNTTRKYFLLNFNNQFKEIVGARAVSTDNVQNFRDIGGYLDVNDNMLKWGNVFRSGDLDKINSVDKLRIKNLNIKTIIDLRTPEEIDSIPEGYTDAKVIHIPIFAGNPKEIMERIKQGRMKKGDGMLFLQDIYLQFVDNDSEQFAQALNLFLDKKNYPILFHCTQGKDRAGFLAALLLAALDVPEETIMKDYMDTNNYVNIRAMASFANNLDSDAQEAITALLSANELYLGVALKKIKKEYGSIHKYLEEKLNFTTKKREKLKEIMLYE